MNLDESKAQYLRDHAAGVAGAGERLLERHPDHFIELLTWLLDITELERQLMLLAKEDGRRSA